MLITELSSVSKEITSQSAFQPPECERCDVCKRKSNKVRLCGGCFRVAYCSHKCQFEAWMDHQSECGPRSRKISKNFVWHGLPLEILGHIFAQMDSLASVIRMRLVCKAFDAALAYAQVSLNLDHFRALNAFAQVSLVCCFPSARHVVLHNRYRDIADRHIAVVACHCPQLRSLIITQLHCTQRIESDPRSDNASRVSTVALRALAFHCPHLEVFSYPGNISCVQDGVNALALSCPNLRSLTLQLSEKWRLPRELRNLPMLTGLKHLDLRATETDIRSTRVLARCTSLKSFSLLFPAGQKPVVGVTHLSWSTLFSSRGASLTRLSLAGLRDAVALENIAKYCVSLTKLSLSGSSVCTDTWVELVVLGNMDLTELDLSFTNIGERTMNAIQKLPHLTALALCRCPSVPEPNLLNVLKTRSTALRSLEIGGGTLALSDRVSSAICQCVNLTRLSLLESVFSAEELTDSLCLLTQLTHLNITVGAVQAFLNDKCARRIIMACPNLVCLSLPRHPVTTRTAQAAARLPNLAALDLSFADIGDVAMNALATCSTLQVLRIGGTSVGDVGIETLLKGCPRLRFLEVYQCKATTEAVQMAGQKGVAVMFERPLDEKMLSVADFIAEEPHPTMMYIQ